MSNESRSMKRQLDDADLFLKNIHQEDLLYSLKARGYEKPSLEEGEELYAKALELMEEKRKLKMDYREANSRFIKASKEAREYFMDGLIAARRATSDAWIREELKLNSSTPRTFLGWTAKADHLYKAVINNKGILAKLKGTILEKDYLEHGLQMLETLKSLSAAQENIKGKSQQTTINRKKAFLELRIWYQTVANTCRRVFRKDPKQLVRLGVKPLYPPR